eukprot:Filipodium_phascolosomae@DN6353_c0_g1_i1.p1
MRAIGRPFPLLGRCCLVQPQQCRLASSSVVIRNVRDVQDALVHQFADRAAKVVAFNRMRGMDGNDLPSCVVTYASAEDAENAVKTLNGQRISNKHDTRVTVQETSFSATSGEFAIEWGRTRAYPDTQGRTVMVSYHFSLGGELVRKHIQSLLQDDSCIENSHTSNKTGISLLRFNTVTNAQSAIKKVDNSEIKKGFRCRAAVSRRDFEDKQPGTRGRI